jgi:predicted phosphoadenosine phosphosulfate sulfurtransferase
LSFKRKIILLLDAIPLDTTDEYFYDRKSRIKFYEKRGFVRCFADGTEMIFNKRNNICLFKFLKN